MFKRLSKLYKNPYVNNGIKLFLILYVVKVLPDMPDFFEDIFKSDVIQFLMISAIVYLSSHDIQMSMIVAIAFILIMTSLKRIEDARGTRNILRTVSTVPRDVVADLIDEIQAGTTYLSENIGGPIARVVTGGNVVVDALQDGSGDLIGDIGTIIL